MFTFKEKTYISLLKFPYLRVIFIFAFFCGVSNDAFGASIPDINAWVKQINAANAKNPSGTSYPIRVAFVDDTYAKSPKFLEFDLESFNNLGLYQAVQSSDLSWSWKLNDFHVKEKAKQDKSKPIETPKEVEKGNKLLDLDSLLKTFDADVFVQAPSDQSKEWITFRIVNNAKEILAKEKSPTSFNTESLYRWLAKSFGYDGVVLAKKGEYLLVGSSTVFFKKKNIQAMAFRDSEKKFSLRPSEREGMGLLTLVKKSGSYGIFKVLFLGRGFTDVPLNTKVLIEDTGQKKPTSSFDLKGPDSK